jgi:Phage integrase family
MARGKRGSGVVPLTEEAAKLYLLYMEHEYGLLDSDYVFVNLWGGELGRPLTYAAVSRLVASTRRRVGFEFTPHELRHTFMSLARHGGVRLEVIRRLVTHRSVMPRRTSTAIWSSRISARNSTRPACSSRSRRLSREPGAPVLAPVPAHEEASWRAALPVALAGLEDHDRDSPPLCELLEEVVSGIEREELRPQPIALFLGRDASADVSELGADLNGRVGVGPQVVKPGGICCLTTLGRHQGDDVAFLVIHHR